MLKAFLPLLILFSSCGFGVAPLQVWVSDEAWLDAATDWAEETGREVRVHYGTADTSPRDLVPRPDILLGPGWLRYIETARDVRGALSRAGLAPASFRPGLYSGDAWKERVPALPLGLSIPVALTRPKENAPTTVELSELFNIVPARRGGMGFSPWWNAELAISLLAMGAGDVESWRAWSEEKNGGDDLEFKAELLSLIPLLEIRENRIGAWVVPATRLPLLSRQETEGMSVRVVTVEGRVPLLPQTHWALLPDGAGGAAEEFLAWLLTGERLHAFLASSPSPAMTALAAPTRGPLPEWLGLDASTRFFLPPEGPSAQDIAALFRGELDWEAFRAKFVLTE